MFNRFLKEVGFWPLVTETPGAPGTATYEINLPFLFRFVLKFQTISINFFQTSSTQSPTIFSVQFYNLKSFFYKNFPPTSDK